MLAAAVGTCCPGTAVGPPQLELQPPRAQGGHPPYKAQSSPTGSGAPVRQLPATASGSDTVTITPVPAPAQLGAPCSATTLCASGVCLGQRCCQPTVDFSCTGCSGAQGVCTECARLFVLVNGSSCVGERFAPCMAHASCTTGRCTNSRCGPATPSGRVSITSIVVAVAVPVVFAALAACGLVCRPIGKRPPPPRTSESRQSRSGSPPLGTGKCTA